MHTLHLTCGCRRILWAGALFLMFSMYGRGDGLQFMPFNYVQDFEGEMPKVSKGGAGYVINYEGQTDEKFFTGRKALKLDVTLKAGYSHLEYYIPVGTIPAEGSLKLSGRFLVEEKTYGKAGLGVYAFIQPSNYGGGAGLAATGPTNGEWKILDVAPVKYADQAAGANWIWGAEAANFTKFIRSICIVVDSYGLKETRIVVYVDDLKMEGEIPVTEQYKAEAAGRWASAAEKINRKISAWEEELRVIEKEIQAVGDEQIKKELLEKSGSLGKEISGLKRQGFFTPAAAKKTILSLERLKGDISKVQAAELP